MATKTMYATGGLKYGTRRLQAGDPVDMDASHQRLYTALGKVTAEKPRVAKARVPTADQVIAEDDAADRAVAKKAGPKRRKAATKKTK